MARFLEAKLSEWEITDIILFGDCRPVHAAAIAIAKRHQIPHYVFEEGYLRPNWITLERAAPMAIPPCRTIRSGFWPRPRRCRHFKKGTHVDGLLDAGRAGYCL